MSHNIFIAAQNGHLRVIVDFIELGGDPNVRDRNGISILDYAMRANHSDIIRYLLEQSADVDLAEYRNFIQQRHTLSAIDAENITHMIDNLMDRGINLISESYNSAESNLHGVIGDADGSLAFIYRSARTSVTWPIPEAPSPFIRPINPVPNLPQDTSNNIATSYSTREDEGGRESLNLLRLVLNMREGIDYNDNEYSSDDDIEYAESILSTHAEISGDSMSDDDDGYSSDDDAKYQDSVLSTSEELSQDDMASTALDHLLGNIGGFYGRMLEFTSGL